MVDVSEVRRRLRQTLARLRQAAAERRAQADTASADYARFLNETAEPVFRMFAIALTAEGHPFKLHTPADGVRLAAERSRDDYIELTLDTSSHPIAVVGRASYGRGRQLTTIERPLRPGAPIAGLTDEDVLAFLLEAIEPLVR